MGLVSIEVGRFAYDVFRINWIKCNVPRNDIQSNQQLENRYPPNFIRSIAKYVRFYQVLIRNDIKTVMKEMKVVKVDDEFSMYEFFNAFMRIRTEIFMYQVMQNVGCSLAICLELTLYKYPTYRRLLRRMSSRWKTYFHQYLQLDFFLNGGFDALFKHAEAMHCSDYVLDKYIYESNRVYDRSGSSIWTASQISLFLEENDIKIDDKIRRSTVSLLNYCSRSENSRLLRMLYRSEMLPVVGRWMKWTRKRLRRIGSILFNRRSRDEDGFSDCSESVPSESSTGRRGSNSEVNESVIYSMIEDYIQSVQEYYRR